MTEHEELRALRDRLVEREARIVLLEERVRQLERQVPAHSRTTCPPEPRDPILFRPMPEPKDALELRGENAT